MISKRKKSKCPQNQSAKQYTNLCRPSCRNGETKKTGEIFKKKTEEKKKQWTMGKIPKFEQGTTNTDCRKSSIQEGTAGVPDQLPKMKKNVQRFAFILLFLEFREK